MTGASQPTATAGHGPVRSRLALAHRVLEVAEQVVGSLLVLAALGLVVLQAAQRYLPVSGWAWTGELARYALVWLTFALAGYLTGRGEHIGIEVVDYLARGRLLALVRRLADTIVAVVAVAFAVDAWHLVTGSTGRTSPVIGIPLGLVYIVPVAGFALTAVRAGWAALLGRPEAAPDPSEPGSRR